MTDQELIAKLRAENAAMASKLENKSKLSCKVSEKGGLSVYGLGRFPVTLYKSQWARLIGSVDMVKAFIVEHDAELIEKA